MCFLTLLRLSTRIVFLSSFFKFKAIILWRFVMAEHWESLFNILHDLFLEFAYINEKKIFQGYNYESNILLPDLSVTYVVILKCNYYNSIITCFIQFIFVCNE